MWQWNPALAVQTKRHDLPGASRQVYLWSRYHPPMLIRGTQATAFNGVSSPMTVHTMLLLKRGYSSYLFDRSEPYCHAFECVLDVYQLLLPRQDIISINFCRTRLDRRRQGGADRARSFESLASGSD